MKQNDTLRENMLIRVILIDDLLGPGDEELKVVETLQWFFDKFFEGVELIQWKDFEEATNRLKEIPLGSISVLLVDLVLLKEKKDVTQKEEVEIAERTIGELEEFLKKWKYPVDPPFVAIITNYPEAALNILRGPWCGIAKGRLLPQLTIIKEKGLSLENIDKSIYRETYRFMEFIQSALDHFIADPLLYNTINYKIKVSIPQQEVEVLRKDYKEDRIDYSSIGYIKSTHFRRRGGFNIILDTATKILQNFGKEIQECFQEYPSIEKNKVYDNVASIISPLENIESRKRGYNKIPQRYLISEINRAFKPILGRIGNLFITIHREGHTLFTWDIEIIDSSTK